MGRGVRLGEVVAPRVGGVDAEGVFPLTPLRLCCCEHAEQLGAGGHPVVVRGRWIVACEHARETPVCYRSPRNTLVNNSSG